MLAELLLVLSGYPSSFFTPSPPPPATPTTLSVSQTLAEYLHPGEVSSLNTLGELAFRYTKIKTWATEIQFQGRQAVLAESLAASSREGRSKGKQRVTDGNTTDEAPSQYLCALAGTILEVLNEYNVLVVTTEARILSMDPSLVQDQQGYVPLSSLVATFSSWQAPMASLAYLVDTLSSSPLTVQATSSQTSVDRWTPGQLLQLIYNNSQTGNPHIEKIYKTLLQPLRYLFLTHLVAFLLYGLAPTQSTLTSPAFALDIGPDPLSPQHRVYSLNIDLLPGSIRGETRESILYVGRVAATLRREGRYLPSSLVDGLRVEIMAVKGLEEGAGLDEAIQKARAEVGEWLWRHILTGSQVAEALEAFGTFFLTRNADYAISVIREISRLRMDKIITANPHSSSSVIRDQDLNLALLRASVGTSAETDHALDNLRFKLEKGPLRPLLPSLSASASHHRRKTDTENPYKEDNNVRDLFSSFLLGTPMIMTTTISWPLDLFMTPPAISAYIDIHTYLLAIRETHLRVLEAWTSLSASQRRRRKWTGSTEGGTKDEEKTRRRLARSSWGSVRAMLFFLDQLQSHFMTDIIDVQHRRLLDQLDSVSTTPIPGSVSGGSLSQSHVGLGLSSMRGSTKPGSPVSSKFKSTGNRPSSPFSDIGRPGSPVPSTIGGETHTVRSRVAPPTPGKSQQNYLDFLTLRQMHARHLSFLREGLLLTDTTCSVIIRDILETCKRFVGLVERWGGDVLPELLMDNTSADEQVGDIVQERAHIVAEITQKLHDLFSDFFRALLDSQNPSSGNSNTEASSIGGTSMSRTSRAQLLRQTSFTATSIARSKAGAAGFKKNKAELEKEERNLEAETVMGRHIEQLLLRLDFNGVLTAWTTLEDEEVTTNLLAEGGL